MVEHGAHQALADAASSELGHDEDVGEVCVDGAIGDGAAEGDLASRRVRAETDRVGNRAFDDGPEASCRPIRGRQERVNEVDVETRRIGRDLEIGWKHAAERTTTRRLECLTDKAPGLQSKTRPTLFSSHFPGLSCFMAIRIVRLGTPRLSGEGLRLGTVRRPPRGVKKEELASRNFYDVWVPGVAPSETLLKAGQRAAGDAARWKAFTRQYQREMKRPDAGHLLDLLAALSHVTDFSVGCYCEDEARCHRSLLRQLLLARGATIA